MKLLFSTLLLVSFSAFSAPIFYAGKMDKTQWQTDLRLDRCEIYTTIPEQGVKIAFATGPKEELSMTVYSSIFPTNKLKYSVAQAINPPWNADLSEQTVQVNANSIGNHQINFKQGVPMLFREISNGHWLTLTSVSYSGKEYLITIPVVAVKNKLSRFTQCVDQLPKMSYQQVNDLSFQYVQNQKKPNYKQVKELQTISDYIKRDPTIVKILIDGHSDTSGNSSQNVLLSKLRADEIAKVLINNKITPELITTRGHGGRYPITSNATADGRAKNRRVLIRLVKADQGS